MSDRKRRRRRSAKPSETAKKVKQQELTSSEEAVPSPVVAVGSQVICKWADSCWYPGIVTSTDEQGRLCVSFVDGEEGVILPSDSIPLKQLKAGTPVTALRDDDLQLVEVSGLFAGFVDPGMENFRISTDERGTQVCGTYRLSLSELAVTKNREQSSNSLESVAEGIDFEDKIPRLSGTSSVVKVTKRKATRKPRTSKPLSRTKKSRGSKNESGKLDCTKDMPGPSSSSGIVVSAACPVVAKWEDEHWYPGSVSCALQDGRFVVTFTDGSTFLVSVADILPLRLVKKGVTVTALKDDIDGLPEANGVFSGFLDSAMEEFMILDPQGEYQVCGTYRLVLSPKSALTCVRESCKGMTEDQREVPRRQRSLFSGHHFVITQSCYDDEQLNSSYIAKVFDDDLLESMVLNRGGKMLSEGMVKKSDKVFVVSDTYCRTPKYLMGLAFGAPPLLYTWIYDCINSATSTTVIPKPGILYTMFKDCLLDHQSYLLPAGMCRHSKQVIFWKPRTKSSVLQGTQLSLIGSETFQQSWEEILVAAGAEIVLGAACATDKQACDLVICESNTSKTIPKRLLFLAKSGSVKLLSTEWAVQSLVHGHKLECYGDYWYNSNV